MSRIPEVEQRSPTTCSPISHNSEATQINLTPTLNGLGNLSILPIVTFRKVAITVHHRAAIIVVWPFKATMCHLRGPSSISTTSIKQETLLCFLVTMIVLQQPISQDQRRMDCIPPIITAKQEIFQLSHNLQRGRQLPHKVGKSPT